MAHSISAQSYSRHLVSAENIAPLDSVARVDTRYWLRALRAEARHTLITRGFALELMTAS
jgi:hypothetical protein